MTLVNQKKEEQEWKTFLAHFPPDISQKVRDYVRDVIFKKSRYLFTTREGKLLYGYCTRCEQKYRVTGLKQNEKVDCRQCGSTCIVKKSGLGRSSLRDRAHIVFYEKSVIDPQAMVARSMYVVRDYRGDYTKVETLYSPSAMYLFKMGETVMYQPHWGSNEWRKCDSVRSEYSYSYTGGYKSTCPKEWIVEAAAGTPFQYSTWENYHEADNVKMFDLFSRYPCIEYLTKLQMKYFVSAKLQGNKTYGAINWNGKSIDKVLKLDKQRAKEFVANIKSINHPITLKLFQLSSKEQAGYQLQELNNLANKLGSCWSLFQKMLKHATLRRSVNYVMKQIAVEKKAKRSPAAAYSVLATFRDYLAECDKLGLNLQDDVVLFPSDLHKAHLKTIEQVKYKESEELNKLIELSLKRRAKYSFEQDGLFIRAAVDTKELINEGNQLRHCVGSYADRYAKGKCDILVIRYASEPEKPFFTMEVIDGKIVQCRGKSNCSMSKEVQHFVDSFTAVRLKPKMKNKKTSVDKTERQEVAV
ncbi:PcfJ domain-containing protein [Paenibacillus sinopodophylli]|uniref:PcfJ domain-containing protein n=1 Tax=Paenibacillus sinopodophylli TaxID=1837342 RepID=UPI00110CB056|nr:PcfJ domain-containing protein [Paenibacillus sinopodophylli]